MQTPTPSSPASKNPVDVSTAGLFLIGAGLWELVFNRLAYAVGLYRGIGATGFLSGLATSGRVAMNSVGIMALVLACISVPRIVGNPRIGSVLARTILIVGSTLYLPLVCVSIFGPVTEGLVLIGYVSAAASATFLSVLVLVGEAPMELKRITVALGLIQLLGAFEMVTRVASLFHSATGLEYLPGRAYLLAEVLYVVTPIFAFLSLCPGRLLNFLLRPHLLGLLTSCVVTGGALYIALLLADHSLVRLVAIRTLRVTMEIPGGLILYLVSLFFGTWLIGSLILPSKRWPPSVESRRIGIGLCCIWLSGIQPTHPYQFALMIVGFFYLARGVVREQTA